MGDEKNIDRLVEETLSSISKIEAVQSPPFFKDKVLNRMAQQKPESDTKMNLLNWFTPRYQLATLICLVLINTIALFYSTSDSYVDNVANFAEVYGLSDTDTESFLYQN